MEPDQAINSRGDVGDIDIVEISVVLVATSNNPSILNPDFLRYNNIVDESWKVQEPHFSSPAYSQVTFGSGLTVKADPERVIFEQRADKLATEDIVSPKIAFRYVKNVPHVPYRAIGINPKAFVLSKGNSAHKVEDALMDKGAWMSFKDLTPQVQLKFLYRYSERTITFDVAEASKEGTIGGNSHGFVYLGNFHRDIRDTKQKERLRKLSQIIESWKEDLSDFRLLVGNFRERK